MLCGFNAMHLQINIIVEFILHLISVIAKSTGACCRHLYQFSKVFVGNEGGAGKRIDGTAAEEGGSQHQTSSSTGLSEVRYNTE